MHLADWAIVKGLCIVSDVFLKLENIKTNKTKVSETGK